MTYGATPEDWLNLDLLGLTADLLPVVANPTAPISPASELKTIGKVPSRYNSQRQIIGIPNWTRRRTTPQEIERWSKNADYGICIQTRLARALDVDVPDPELAATIEALILEYFRSPPTRRRPNSSKFLIPFLLPGEYAKRTMKTKNGMIEFLATGQQFVAIGTHTSGIRYEGLENISALPELTPEQFESLWQKLTEKFAIEPPSSSSLRNPLTNSSQGVLAALRDPVVAYMEKQGLVTGLGKEGQIFITCPFAEGHSEHIEGGTSTAYLPAGHRDYEQGHFSCLHASCHHREDVDFLDKIGYRMADFDVVLPDLECPEEPKKARFGVVPAEDFSRLPPVNWLIKNILREKGFFQFYGGSGDGKTFAVLDMMLCLCRGVDWNGHKTTRPCRVVYICAEGSGGFISRLRAYAHKNNDLGGLNLGVIPETPNFRIPADVKLVASQVNAFGRVDMVIIDTLAQVTPGADENTGKDMGLAIRHCDELRKLTNAGVGLVHHAGKDPSRGARGWSGLKAPLDAEFSVSKIEGGLRRFWVEKMKDGRDGFGYDFELETIVFGEDKDGDVLDSCVVKYLGSSSNALKKKPVLKGKNQNLVYDSFMNLGGGEIAFAALVDEALKFLPQTARGSRDRRPQRVAEALESLCSRGELKYERGMVFAPL